MLLGRGMFEFLLLGKFLSQSRNDLICQIDLIINTYKYMLKYN